MSKQQRSQFSPDTANQPGKSTMMTMQEKTRQSSTAQGKQRGQEQKQFSDNPASQESNYMSRRSSQSRKRKNKTEYGNILPEIQLTRDDLNKTVQEAPTQDLIDRKIPGPIKAFQNDQNPVNIELYHSSSRSGSKKFTGRPHSASQSGRKLSGSRTSINIFPSKDVKNIQVEHIVLPGHPQTELPTKVGRSRAGSRCSDKHDTEAFRIKTGRSIASRKSSQAHELRKIAEVNNWQPPTGSNADLGGLTDNDSLQRRKTRVNQFKKKNMSDKEVIDFLYQVCDSNLAINPRVAPTDFDSTNELDSFLEQIIYCSRQNMQTQGSKAEFDKMHLATGTRTPICMETLSYIVKHQTKETILVDAVDFFSTALERLVFVEKQNSERGALLDTISVERTELTSKMFDLTRKLSTTSQQMLKQKQQEHEQMKLIVSLKRQLDAKNAECESLMYRLKINGIDHEVEQRSDNEISALQNVEQLVQEFQEGPQTVNDFSEGLNSQSKDSMAPSSDLAQVQRNIQSDFNQIRNAIANSGEISINEQSMDPVTATIDRIQENMNRIQVYSEKTTAQNKHLTQKMDQKERLVRHLEDKVTQIMVQKEDVVVKMKSEIVLMQNELAENKNAMERQRNLMKQTIRGEEKKACEDATQQLENEVEELKKQDKSQKHKIERQKEIFEELKQEFEAYRNDRVEQEKKREEQVSKIEAEMRKMSKAKISQKETLDGRVQALEKQLDLNATETKIVFLRLKYLRQIVETLQRQKVFLQKSLQKGKKELQMQMSDLQHSMLSQNKNQSYFISVEKALNQTQSMVEISVNQLESIEQIVGFLKVDKMYNLVFDEDPQEPIMEPSIQEEPVAQITSASALELTSYQEPPPKVVKPSLLKNTQHMLDQVKQMIDLPINFRPKPLSKINQENQNKKKRPGEEKDKKNQIKNEEYFLEHNQTELISILLKFVTEMIMKIGGVQQAEQLPPTVSRILYLANLKSDLDTENDIFTNYLQDCKAILDEEFDEMLVKIQTHDDLKQLGALDLPDKIQMPHFNDLRNRKLFLENEMKEKKLEGLVAGSNAGDKSDIHIKRDSVDSIKNSVENSDEKVFKTYDKNRVQSRLVDVNNRSVLQAVTDEYQLQDITAKLTEANITIKEQKDRSHVLQQSLAMRIVKLEDTIDNLEITKERELNLAEETYRQEIAEIKKGASVRENDLIEQIQQHQDAYVKLQTEYEKLQKEKDFLEEQLAEMSDVSVRKPHESLDESREESVHSLQLTKDPEAGPQIAELQQQLANYSKNVQHFINIRESNVSMFTLVFEADETNMTLVNESMLTYYLSKTFKIAKDKFRVLTTENYVADHVQQPGSLDEQVKGKVGALSKPHQPIALVKITIELSEDLPNIQRALSLVRSEIRDGSSLLFDLVPVYMGICLGRSGLATRNRLDEFHLLEKRGMNLNGEDFVTSVMRNKTNPYVFMVIIMNLKQGSEYVLELLESDILQLVEGNQGLLEQPEPKELQRMILQGLELMVRDQTDEGTMEVKVLTCEHRIFFNTLWQDVIISRVQQEKQLLNQRPDNVRSTDIIAARGHVAANQFVSKQMKTTHRDDRLKGLAAANIAETNGGLQNHGQSYDPKMHGSLLKNINYQSKLIAESSTQTDFQASLLYDTSNAVFKSHNKLGDKVDICILINEAKKDQSLILQFQEQSTMQTIKFCIFKNQNSVNIHSGNQSSKHSINSQKRALNNNSALDGTQSPTDLSPQRSNDGQNGINSPTNNFNLSGMATGRNQDPQSYMLHTQVIHLEQEHIVLVSVERIQNDGLLVKLHDTKFLSSDQFYLVRKSNGHLTRVNLDATIDLVFEPEFRHMVYQLAFEQYQTGPDIVFQSMENMSEKLVLSGKNPSQASNELFKLPSRKNAGKVTRLKGFQIKGNVFYGNQPAAIQEDSQFGEDRCEDSMIEWKSLQDRGVLLYRDTLKVRCNLEGRPETPQDALISLHLKDREVQIEVFLYRDSQKMSITSSVGAYELFQRDPIELNFLDRIGLLHEMLEKLYVVQQDNKFHMKVEAEAVPISKFTPPKDLLGSPSSTNALASKTTDQAPKYSGEKYEELIGEFRMNKEQDVEDNRAKLFSRMISQTDGTVYELQIYVRMRRQRRDETGKQRKQTVNKAGKSETQIEAQRIENFIDEQNQLDSIYIQTIHPETEEIIAVYFDKKRLAFILAEDLSTNYVQVITEWQKYLIDYFSRNAVIHAKDHHIEIFNHTDYSNDCQNQARTSYSHRIVERIHNPILITFSEKQDNILDRQLLLNQEFDFTELSYDIKVYRVYNKSKFGCKNLHMGNETLSYQIEIFNLNEPWVIYKNNYPIKNPETNCEDPITITSHVLNLVNHPYDNVDSEGNVRNAALQRHTDKYKALFQRYIDNQLILTIQEEKFPSAIKFCLVEPCSNLIWRFKHEPSSEIVRPAHFAIIDKGSIEGLMTCILDSVQPEPLIVSKEVIRDSGVWKQTSNLFFVKEEEIADKLLLNIQKVRDQLNIRLCKQTGEINSKKQNALLAKMLETTEANTGERKDYNKSTHEVLMEIQIDNVFENTMISKILNQDDSDRTTHAEALFFMINTSEDKFNITVIRLADKTPIFSFEFTQLRDTTMEEEEEPTSPDRRKRNSPLKKNKPLNQYSRQIKEALGQLNTPHMVETAYQDVEAYAAKKAKESLGPAEAKRMANQKNNRIQTFETLFSRLQSTSAHQSRFYQRNFGKEKVIALHRKIFFDEDREKLIIATANISYTQDSYPAHLKSDNPMLLPFEVEQINFDILEPESDEKTFLTIDLLDYFTEVDLQALNRHDIGKIKHLAKILLEERGIIKRLDAVDQMTNNSMEGSPNSSIREENTKYTLSFSQQMHMDPANAGVHMPSSMDGISNHPLSDGGILTPPDEIITIQPNDAAAALAANGDMMDFQIRHSMSGSQKNSVIVEEDEEDHDSVQKSADRSN